MGKQFQSRVFRLDHKDGTFHCSPAMIVAAIYFTSMRKGGTTAMTMRTRATNWRATGQEERI